MKLPFLWGLWVYRNAISPLDGPRCALWPTCSRYATEAIGKHGPLIGGFLAADRLIHEGSVRPPEYPVIEKYGRRYLHDPVEKNDSLFRRAAPVRAEEKTVPAGRDGERFALAALADAALARETARRLQQPFDAITEWKRAAFLSTDRALASEDLAEAGWTAVRAGVRLDSEDAFDDADRAFDDARREAVLAADAEAVFRAEYGRAFTSLARGYHPEAARRFEKLAQANASGASVHLEAAWLGAWARFGLALRDGEPPKKAAEVFKAFDTDLARGAIEFAADERASWRSPQVAVAMQMLVPGAGYAYAGRPLIGAGSFMLNAAFIAAAVLAVREGNYPLAAILVSLETGWYFGGAAGAAQAAVDRNTRHARQVERRMRKRFLGAVGPNGAAGVLLF